jgi:phosphatidylglycerol:prolipoprotein diacylglycerol transferase
MYPILFTIPGLDLPIRSFGVMVAAGFLVGSAIWSRLLARYGDDPEHDPERSSQVGLWVLVGILVGARALYVAVEVFRYWAAEDGAGMVGQQFVESPLEMLKIWQGGLVMYGAAAGGTLFGAICSRRVGLGLPSALDTAAVSAAFGLAVGRVGCLLVGDDFGAIVPERFRHLPFPITLRVPALEDLREGSLFANSTPPVAGEVLWATQPWMTINAVLLGLLGLWLLKRRSYRGQVALILVVLYAAGRAAIEAFRGDVIRGLWFGDTLSTSQLISLVIGVTAIAFLLKNRGRRDLPAPDAAT